MKDSVISAKVKKREINIFIILLIASFVANIISIMAYNSDWIEVVSALHYVVILAVVLYVIQGVIRLIIWGIRRLLTRQRSQ